MSLLFIAHPKETDLALFAGGELGPLSRWRIEQHLQQCAGCQEAVADFFHLQSEVGGLSDLPAVDWKALAHNIAVRVSVEAPATREKEPHWLAHPRVWQAGLAAAALLCTIVVVRQLPTVSENAKQAPAVIAETPATEQDPFEEKELALANQPRQNAAVAPETTPLASSQFAQPVDEASSRDALTRESNETAAGARQRLAAPAVEQPGRQDQAFRFEARGKTAPGDIEAQSAPPAAEPVAVQAANLAVAPPPPLSPAPRAEAGAEGLQDRAAVGGIRQGIVGGAAYRQSASVATEQRKVERVELAQAPQAAPPSRRALTRVAALDKKTDADAAVAPERGFTVLPAALQDPAVDVGVAADGWISIRAVDANSGTITITDVYVP
jgi:hypothetical protein